MERIRTSLPHTPSESDDEVTLGKFPPLLREAGWPYFFAASIWASLGLKDSYFSFYFSFSIIIYKKTTLIITRDNFLIFCIPLMFRDASSSWQPREKVLYPVTTRPSHVHTPVVQRLQHTSRGRGFWGPRHRAVSHRSQRQGMISMGEEWFKVSHLLGNHRENCPLLAYAFRSGEAQRRLIACPRLASVPAILINRGNIRSKSSLRSRGNGLIHLSKLIGRQELEQRCCGGAYQNPHLSSQS